MNRQDIFRHAMNTIYYSGLASMSAPMLRGLGAYMMLHHIVPGGGLQKGFAPNKGLEITPEFLSEVIQFVKGRGYNIVSIEQSYDILSGKVSSDKPFIVFTIDDGYRDNLKYALPVFEQHQCPFTIFIAPQITDGKCELWWRGLEQAIAENTRIKASIDNAQFDLTCASLEEKTATFETLYWPVRNLPEYEQRCWIREFCADHGVDLAAQCKAAAMNWDELRKIDKSPLCTLGAHTVNHFAVAKLSREDALSQAINSRDRIHHETGNRPAFFAYPYGDEGSAGPRDFELMKEAGFKLALTTRKGLVYDAHKAHLTALPRLSLNGSFQQLHYIAALLSGLPFAVFNKFRKLNVS